MSESGQERTESATPRRRQQARKKGTVAKSNDLTGSIVLMALILVLPSAIGKIGEGLMQSMTSSFSDIPSEIRPETLGFYCLRLAQPALLGLGLIIGTALVLGLAVNFGQVGFVMSGEALTPSFSKINPANGLKRMFSFSATFEGLKASAKCGVFIYLGWSVISSSWPELVQMSSMTPTHSMAAIGSLIKSISLRIALVWLVLAALDYFVQRKQVEKQLRMTKEEVKQEMKEAETSPELRAAQAARRRKLSKGRMKDAVKTADVIVTNPTHFAVAIKYDPNTSHAPIVVAKGADFLAAKIREVAGENRVPIVPNPPLARALYKKCEVGDVVPRELFQAVAEVLAFVYRAIKKINVSS